MMIENNKNYSFTGKFINYAKIGKYVKEKNAYKDIKSSFVEIDCKSKNDVKSLENAINYWEDDKFGMNALYAVKEAQEDGSYYSYHKVYTLTSQNDNFELLNSDKILGVIHVSPMGNNKLYVDHIQTNPKYLYSMKPEYAGIGTAMIESIKKLCNMITLFPAKEKSVKDFYYKNGFQEYGHGTNCFVWIKDIFERL